MACGMLVPRVDRARQMPSGAPARAHERKEDHMATVTIRPKTTTSPATAVTSGGGLSSSYDRGVGWVIFAATMFVVSAALNVIWGIAAVSNSHFFIANTSYILSDLNTWGWVAIGFGALESLAALSIWRGGAFGRWFGIAVAGLAILVAMMSLPAYPLWSLVLVAIYALVIYALAVYGGKPELTA
jgi:hypothetical protein